MTNEQLTPLLELFKLDMGISHSSRDTLFSTVIKAAFNEIRTMGAKLDLSKADDQMLVVDYALWTYRKRQDNTGISRNLQFRIHNRIVKEAASGET